MKIGDQRAQGRVGSAAARAAAGTMATCLILLTLGLGALDGTGLFAPENWVDAGLVPTSATSPAWATVVFLPLLVVGSAVLLVRTLRAAREGTRARWVLGAAWSVLVVTAFAAKLVYSLVLLAIAGVHDLHAGPTGAALLAECGLTGAKYAVFGVFAVVPAALVYRIVARRAIAAARRTPAAVPRGSEAPKPGPGLVWSRWWLVVGVLVAEAAANSSYAWAGGTGREWLLPFAGLAGSVLVLSLAWPRIAAGLATDSAVALAWVCGCVTTAASALGFLLALVLDGMLSGFGGALYPVVGSLMYVAAGVTAGITAAVAGALWALVRARTPLGALAARFEARPLAGSRAGRTALIAGVVALAVGLQTALVASASIPASFPVPPAPSSDGGALLPLTVRHQAGTPPTIADSAGRQVLLRGVNVNQLIDYGQRDPAVPTVRPLGDDDYAQMASDYGFDVQRLGLSWSLLEPQRGVFDQNYIARIRTAVDQAAAHGIYTVLDMHQDTYSKYVTAAPGTTCRPGSTPEFGNDGAPDWATLTGGAKGCGFQGRDLSPNVEQSFTNLYDDTDGIGGQLAATWGEVARAFAGDSAVAGYDLLNEPGPGNAPGVTSGLLLGRLYQQITAAIRTGENSAPDGFHHLVFFEPSILWSGLGFDVTPPAGFSDDPDLVFSPHLYSESITMDQGLGVTLTTIEQGFTTARRTAAAYGTPLWSGEWGWFGDPGEQIGQYERFLGAQNEAMLGSAIWVWKKACGDPQSDPAGRTAGGLDVVSCPDGADAPGSTVLTTALGQAYPRAVPGRLNLLSSSATRVDVQLTGSGSGALDVWIPGSDTEKPTVATGGLTQVALSAQPGGGWRLTGTAAGDYTVMATR